jgi:hypothetical protein
MLLSSPVRSIHCAPASALKVIPPPWYLSLMIPTCPLTPPTTRQPEKACPVEYNLPPPTGTAGTSELPFLTRLVVADAVTELAIKTPTASAAHATPR